MAALPAAARFRAPSRAEHTKDAISMPIISAKVPTANASKYIQQLCKHWSHRLEVDFTEQKGVVRFPDAVVALEARPEDLSVTIDAQAKDTVERMKGVVSAHLDRFAFREAPLKFDWSEPEVI
jgi:hypothetical protein